MNDSADSALLDGTKPRDAWCNSTSMLTALIENLPDIIAIIDCRGDIVFVNRPANVDGIGMDATDSLGFLTDDSESMCRRALRRAFETSLPQSVQLQDIRGQWWLGRVVPMAGDGDPEHCILICTDVTRERLATEAVAKEQRLLRHLLDLHERERKLIAYEIHDGFAQQLAGALFRLQGFRHNVGHDGQRAWQDFDVGVGLVSKALDETRRLISGLQPPVLEESGVVEAIEYLVCEQKALEGPDVEFVHEVAFGRLAPPLEIAIFRIVQESLQNACRHSGSNRVRIELRQHGDWLHVAIHDWGRGLPTEETDSQRFGLRGIHERVRLADGQIIIESAKDQGTHIMVELPLTDSAL